MADAFQKLTPEFEQAAAGPKNLNVLVMGAGVMGRRHIESLKEISEKILEPRFGTHLDIAAVDKRPEMLAALPEGVKTFAALEDALDAQHPEIALMAFNDNAHRAAFQTLLARAPEVSAILSEKPLTETYAQARELEPELRKRYLSMNTVINFSPVFDRLREYLPALEKETGGLKPIGFEAVWGKDRTSDTRPTIGVPSESVHALSVVTDMFHQHSLEIEKASALRGKLTDVAPDVVYEIDATIRCGNEGLPMKFHSSYVFAQQERAVIAYYQAPDKTVFAVDLQFDVTVNGKKTDRLQVHKISPVTGALETILDECPEHIVNGVAPGLLKNDRVTAFNSLSMLDYLTPADLRKPEVSQRLSNLDTALEVQRQIEQISADNPAVSVTVENADPQRLHKPKYASPALASPAERLSRIRALTGNTSSSRVRKVAVVKP